LISLKPDQEEKIQKKVAEIVLELECGNWKENSKKIARKIITTVRYHDSCQRKNSHRVAARK